MNDEAIHMEAWARETGAWALEIFQDAAAAPPRRKADRSWVTEADETIERRLRAMINFQYPGDTIMGEEEGGVASTSGRVWILDPIDGTGSFVKRLPVWCVSIGLFVDGSPAAGCIYLPVTDECYVVGLDGPARLNGREIRAEPPEPFESQAWIAVPSNAHRKYQIDFPGKTRALGSTAANICYVARGSATGALLGRSSLWDIAAAIAILERAGGRLGPLDGSPMDWRTLFAGHAAPSTLMASGSATYDELRAMLNER